MTGSFAEELARYGPDGSEPVSNMEQAREYCRVLATTHYENFPLVSWMLPRRLHQHFHNVYAYCRWADDLADEVESTTESLSLLQWWREQLAECYQGRCSHPVFVALGETIDQFEIPQEPFLDLISAFEQDQHQQEYETFAALQDYCRRSADPVGRLVLYLCEAHSERNVRWSDSICTGLQLANFWQDVSRDLDIGRIYLPREDRNRFGYSEELLQNRETTPEFLALMEFEVERAREFLLRGKPLIRELPGRLQIDIDLFLRGGLKILGRIEAIGYRVWEQRPVVRKRDVMVLGMSALGAWLLRPVTKRLRPHRQESVR